MCWGWGGKKTVTLMTSAPDLGAGSSMPPDPVAKDLSQT